MPQGSDKNHWPNAARGWCQGALARTLGALTHASKRRKVLATKRGPMGSPFSNSYFYHLLKRRGSHSMEEAAILGGITGSSFDPNRELADLPFVFFDFETTGLDTKSARIIEIGAVKFVARREVARVTTLVNPGVELPPEITQITGITNEMVVDAPPAHDVLEQFHDLLRGCVGVAHNAEFDCQILGYESARLGIQCSYTVLCTLKMARNLVDLPKRNLDALAEHFGLTFESRHRSTGDILVTAGLLWKLLDAHPRLITLKDVEPFMEPVPRIR
jgi:DNA polymerase III epsilon subunit family exonuclease